MNFWCATETGNATNNRNACYRIVARVWFRIATVSRSNATTTVTKISYALVHHISHAYVPRILLQFSKCIPNFVYSHRKARNSSNRNALNAEWIECETRKKTLESNTMIICMHFISFSGFILEVKPLDWRETKCDMRLRSIRAGESHYKYNKQKQKSPFHRAPTYSFPPRCIFFFFCKYFEKLWIKYRRKRDHIQFGINSNQYQYPFKISRRHS